MSISPPLQGCAQWSLWSNPGASSLWCWSWQSCFRWKHTPSLFCTAGIWTSMQIPGTERWSQIQTYLWLQLQLIWLANSGYSLLMLAVGVHPIFSFWEKSSSGQEQRGGHKFSCFSWTVLLNSFTEDHFYSFRTGKQCVTLCIICLITHASSCSFKICTYANRLSINVKEQRGKNTQIISKG